MEGEIVRTPQLERILRSPGLCILDAPGLTSAWIFAWVLNFAYGVQAADNKTLGHYAWVVHGSDVDSATTAVRE